MSWEYGVTIPPEGGDSDAFLLLVPCPSIEWARVAYSQIYGLTRGRLYARDSGIIKDAQATGMSIWRETMLVNWQELIDAIEGVSVAMGDLHVDVQVPAQICCDSVTPPDPPPPPETPPPPPGTTDPPPAFPTPAEYDEYLCKLANWIWWLYWRILTFLSGLDLATAVVVLIIAGLGVLLPEGLSTAIGGVTLATIAATIVSADLSIEVIAATASVAADSMEEDRQQQVCFVYNAFSSGGSLMDGVRDVVLAWLAGLPVPLAERLADVVALGATWIESKVDLAIEFFPEVVGAVDCACVPSTCGCGDCYDADLMACVPNDVIVPPSSVAVNIYEDPSKYTLDWQYNPETGELYISLSFSGNTSASTPGVGIAATFDSPPAGSRLRRLLRYETVGAMDGTWWLEGDAVVDGVSFRGGSTSQQVRECVRDWAQLAGFDYIATGSDVSTNLILETVRPGTGNSKRVELVVTMCWGWLA